MKGVWVAAAGSYAVQSATTGELAPGERADFWSEHVTSYQCALDYTYPRTDCFHGDTVRMRTDTHQLVHFWSDPVTYTRTPLQVRRDPDEDYRLMLPLAGELVVRQDGQETRIAPGTGSLFTLGAPFEVTHDAATRAFIMTIPARGIDGPLNRTSPLATGLDLTVGLGGVVRAMTISLFKERENLTHAQFDAVSERITELLCMLATGDDRPDAPGNLGEVDAMVRRYVREHAGDPTLTGATMARALGWSLRQVQLALQRVGTTPRELIREERLRLARERLQNPACRQMTITDIAHASGFSSVSSLSNAFRRRFEVSPRELRYTTGTPADGAARQRATSPRAGTGSAG